MDFLGIGPLELLFIVLIALIILGPKDMVNTTRTIGRFLRRLVTSQGWADFRRSMQSLRNLPYQMMREAGLDEVTEDLNKGLRDLSQSARLPPIGLSLEPVNPDTKRAEGVSTSVTEAKDVTAEPTLPFDDRLAPLENHSDDLAKREQPSSDKSLVG